MSPVYIKGRILWLVAGYPRGTSQKGKRVTPESQSVAIASEVIVEAQRHTPES